MKTYNVTYIADQIEASIGRQPIIQNRTWHIWDVPTMQYIDTGVVAEGTDGSAEIAAQNAILAESWAVGGTGTREGEDTNNAKYWAEFGQSAENTTYDNSASGLESENVQEAIDELSAKKASLNSETGFLYSEDLPIVPITKGGTGASTKEQAWSNLSVPGLTNGVISSEVLPIVPITKGGTGASTAVSARNNLDIYSTGETEAKLKEKVNVIGKGKNILVNWYFIGGGSQQGGGQFPLNQRGATEYAGFGYGIDRWRSENTSGYVMIRENYVRLNSMVNSDSAFLVQKIENHKQYYGKTLTLSALLDNNVFVTGTMEISSSGIVNYEISIGTDGGLSLYSHDGSYLQVHFRAAGGKLLFIKAVKLELGSIQTLAHQENGTWILNDTPPNYAIESIKCSMALSSEDNLANYPFTRFLYGSYVGTGTFGIDNPNSLTFPFAPKLIYSARNLPSVFFLDDSTAVKYVYMPLVPTSYTQYCGFCANYKVNLYGKSSEDGKTITWYTGSSTASGQNNIQNATYNYIALG